MKKLTLFVLLTALLAIGASAIQISSPTLGGEKQDRVSNVATTFTVTNNETVALTNIQFSFSGGAENTKYALAVTGPANLSAGASGTYTINGTVPLDFSGVDATSLEEQSLKIGVLTVSGTAGASQTASSDIMMQAANRLSINKVRIECDTKSQSIDDGDRVKNLKPGQSCTLEIEVENEFDDDDRNNLKIGDIAFDTIDIRLDSSDSDVEVDEEDDLDDLDANDKDSVTADIESDEEADDGSVTISLQVTGRDENGALHGEDLEFRLDITRLSHDVQITNMDLTPALVSNCEDSKVRLTVLVLNQGKRDEDEVSVEVSVPDFKFSKRFDNIQLDRDDSTSVSFDLIVPENFEAGVVRVDVNTFFDSVAPSNSGSIELNIDECKKTVEPEQTVVQPSTPSTTVVVTDPTPTQTQGQAQAAPVKKSSFTDSNAYVGLLALLSVLIAGSIVALVFTLLRKKA